MYRDEFGRLPHYKLDGYFIDAKGINMQWNLMDVGITDVHDVIPVIENHYRLWESQCNSHMLKKSTTRIGIYSSRYVVLQLQIIPYIK